MISLTAEPIRFCYTIYKLFKGLKLYYYFGGGCHHSLERNSPLEKMPNLLWISNPNKNNFNKDDNIHDKLNKSIIQT